MDTDDEIMENALNSCYTDLYKADKSIYRPDGSLQLCRLRNYSIYSRTSRPDFFDRNGIYREPRYDNKYAGKMSPIFLQSGDSKISCTTLLGGEGPKDVRKSTAVVSEESSNVWEQRS